MSLAILANVQDRAPSRGNKRLGAGGQQMSMSSPISTVGAATSKSSFDRPLHAAVARFTGGVSPAALSQAYTDWLQHFLFSPDKQIELLEKAIAQWGRFLEYCPRACADPSCTRCIEPLSQDNRFRLARLAR
jgi:Poly-beta-hydroxybutyrate polymerase N terminal